MTDPIIESPNDTSSMAKLVYILYLIGLVSGLTALVGVVIAYINKNESSEWLKSHYQYQIRTFWIGLLMIVIGVVLSMVLVGLLLLLFFYVWGIIRSIKGFQALERKQAIANPTTWMF